MSDDLHVFTVLGPEYFGITTATDLEKFKSSKIPLGMKIIVGSTVEDIKTELCRMIDRAVENQVHK